VTFDTAQTSVAELRRWVEECGYHCAGQSVPSHVCDLMAEPDPADEHTAMPAATREDGSAVVTAAPSHEGHRPRPMPEAGGPAIAAGAMPTEQAGHEMAAAEGMPSAHEVMGHGGAAGMSMESMVADMRNRFLAAAVFSVPIFLWSPIGRNVLGFTVAAPFGLRDDVWLLLLSLPVIFYSSWIFFDGAVRALRARTLDMMVLVAVAIGAGWLYSLVVTLTGGGDTFYEPAFGLVLRPEIAALSMSGSSFLVAVSALLLKRLRLPSLTQQGA
jgi:P-type Cu2+ transporter